MKCAQRLFVPLILIAFSACMDVSDPSAPSEDDWASFSSVAASTPVIYSNFGPGMTFDTDPLHSWTINGFLSPTVGQQAISHQFTPARNSTFGSAQVVLSLARGAGGVNVYLQEDLNGLPGAVIEEIPVTGLTSAPTILTATSTLSPPLSKETPYWLTVVAGADGMIAGWHWNSVGDVSAVTFASTQGGSVSGPWGLGPPQTRAVFQINGPSTPKGVAEVLLNDVEVLVSQGILSRHQGRSLTRKLTATIRSMDRCNTRAACSQLAAFIRQVNGFVVSGKLPVATGQELTASAEIVRRLIGCSIAKPKPRRGSVLIDASRDGGAWWFPQGASDFDPELPHQGKDFADHLKSLGYEVRELPRPYTIDNELLAPYDIVVRAGEAGPYEDGELVAYDLYVRRGGKLLLLSDYVRPTETGVLGNVYGLQFAGITRGSQLMDFVPHQVTAGVQNGEVHYGVGSGVVEYPRRARILGRLDADSYLDLNDNSIQDAGEPTAPAVMGVMQYARGRILFAGDVNFLLPVPQPLTDNIVNWLQDERKEHRR